MRLIMENEEVRQSLNREIRIELLDSPDDACDIMSLMSIGSPHIELGEGKRIFLEVHGSKVSFGIPKDDLCRFLIVWEGSVQQSGYLRIKGIDTNGNFRCYCFRVNEKLKRELTLQRDECLHS